MIFEPSLGNPAVAGLAGGLVLLLLQTLWGRVVGQPNEKSIPLQLAEINTKLAEINTTLKVMEHDAAHDRKAHDELKKDFYDHMDRHHNQ